MLMSEVPLYIYTSVKFYREIREYDESDCTETELDPPTKR